MILIAALVASLVPTGTDAHAAPLPEANHVSTADVFAAMDLDRPGLEGVRREVEAGDLDAAAGEWAAYMAQRTAPRLHFGRDTWAQRCTSAGRDGSPRMSRRALW